MSDSALHVIITFVKKRYLSYDVAVIQWITSCHKTRMTTRVITLWREDITLLTTSVSTTRFLLEILSVLKAIKSHFKGSFDKQNLTLLIISYEIYETRRRRRNVCSKRIKSKILTCRLCFEKNRYSC